MPSLVEARGEQGQATPEPAGKGQALPPSQLSVVPGWWHPGCSPPVFPRVLCVWIRPTQPGVAPS